MVVALLSSDARADAPAFSISELPASPSKTFIQPRPNVWTHTFYLYMSSEEALSLDQLQVHIQSFQSNHAPIEPADSKPPLLPVDGSSKVVDRGHPAKLTVSTRFVEPDTYATSVFIFIPGQPSFVRDFSVQVGAATAPALALKQLGPQQFSTRAGSATDIVLTVENTSDSTQEVDVHPGRLMRRATGEPDTDSGLTPVARPNKLTVAPRSTAPITVHLAGPDAGEYTGEVRLASPGVDAVVLTEKIYSKSSIAFAALLIALGVGLSSLVAYLRDRWLVRQDLKIQLQRVRQQLPAIQPAGWSDAIRDIWTRLVYEGERIAEDISLDKPGIEVSITSYAERVALLAEAARADAAITTLAADAARREQRQQLSAVLGTLGDTKATDLADARKRLLDIATSTTKTVELTSTLHALQASVGAHLQTRDEELTKQLNDEITPVLEEASALERQGKLEQMEKALERARNALAKAGASAIRRSFQLPQPHWADRTAFEALKVRVESIDVKTDKDYLALREIVDDGLKRLTRNAAIAAKIDTAALDSALEAKAITAALAELRSQLDASRAPGGEDGMHYVNAPVPALVELPSPPASPPSPRASAPLRWQALRTHKLGVELLLVIITLGLAVVSGLKVLWFGSASWGSGNDFINAALWGIGAKIGVDTFVGLANLRAAIARG